ncbi:YlcI/YnfO family protein [Ramlibacter sp. AN1133]|uniref:YlcI/YnfO family protein n=1 Tax=Ramlibacter sp. AN1133 TaxID=3133429 RepID=UPI0030BB27CA
MKTATLPAIRVEPELREKIEAVLDQGETLSSFMEATLRSAVEFRAIRNEFHARGKRSQEHFDATGISYATEEVLEKLRAKTQRRREQLLRK